MLASEPCHYLKEKWEIPSYACQHAVSQTCCMLQHSLPFQCECWLSVRPHWVKLGGGWARVTKQVPRGREVRECMWRSIVGQGKYQSGTGRDEIHRSIVPHQVFQPDVALFYSAPAKKPAQCQIASLQGCCPYLGEGYRCFKVDGGSSLLLPNIHSAILAQLQLLHHFSIRPGQIRIGLILRCL